MSEGAGAQRLREEPAFGNPDRGRVGRPSGDRDAGRGKKDIRINGFSQQRQGIAGPAEKALRAGESGVLRCEGGEGV